MSFSLPPHQEALIIPLRYNSGAQLGHLAKESLCFNPVPPSSLHSRSFIHLVICIQTVCWRRVLRQMLTGPSRSSQPQGCGWDETATQGRCCQSGEEARKSRGHRLGGQWRLGRPRKKGVGPGPPLAECGLTAGPLSPGYHELLKGFKEWSKRQM